jgi:hypothetical protein
MEPNPNHTMAERALAAPVDRLPSPRNSALAKRGRLVLTFKP